VGLLLKRVKENDEQKNNSSVNVNAKEKNLRRSYKTPVKQRVLALSESLGPHKAAEKLGIHVNNINRWKIQGASRKKGSGRKIVYPDLEEDLIKYLRTMRERRSPVTAKKLTSKGRQMAKEKNYTTIKFSHGWLQKFMHRNHLSVRQRSSTVSKEESILAPLVDKFLMDFCKKVFDTDDFDHNNILNMDETAHSRSHSFVNRRKVTLLFDMAWKGCTRRRTT
jgi:hypothetical protein